MGINDILRKVEDEGEKLLRINSALSHGSLSENEREELRRERCRIKGTEYVSSSEIRRKKDEKQANKLKMKAESEYVDQKYGSRIGKLNGELNNYRTWGVIEKGSSGTRFSGGSPNRCGYIYGLFTRGKAEKLEKQIENLEEQRDQEIHDIEIKYGESMEDD